MADNPFIDDPEGFLRGLLTPKTIVDSLIEATEPLVDALQLNAKACLQGGLALAAAVEVEPIRLTHADRRRLAGSP